MAGQLDGRSAENDNVKDSKNFENFDDEEDDDDGDEDVFGCVDDNADKRSLDEQYFVIYYL